MTRSHNIASLLLLLYTLVLPCSAKNSSFEMQDELETAQLAKCNAKIAKTPNSAQAYYDRAKVYLLMCDDKNGLADLAKCIQLDPKFALAYEERINVYGLQKKQKEALSDCEMLIKIRPDTKGFERKCIVLQSMGRLKEALEACEQALKINPKSTTVWQYKTSIYIEQKDDVNAMKCLTKLIELMPTNATNYHVRANYYLQQGKYDLAIQDLNHAVKIQSGDTEPLIIRGDAYRASKRYAEAIADYSNAIKLDEPRCGAALYGRSLCERALGKNLEADRDLKRSQYFAYEPTAKKAPPKLLAK